MKLLWRNSGLDAEMVNQYDKEVMIRAVLP
jgi:hypothetical protein